MAARRHGQFTLYYMYLTLPLRWLCYLLRFGPRSGPSRTSQPFDTDSVTERIFWSSFEKKSADIIKSMKYISIRNFTIKTTVIKGIEYDLAGIFNRWPSSKILLNKIDLSKSMAASECGLLVKDFYCCLIWFFTSHQQSFSYLWMGLTGLN